MSEIRRMLSDTVDRLFGDRVTPDAMRRAEEGSWLGDLWDAALGAGLTTPHLGEAAGGAGGTWREAHVVARGCGRYCVPLPIAERMLAGWLLEQAGLDVPDGPLTVAPHPVDGGVAARVPWGRHATHVVVAAPGPSGLRVALHARDRAPARLGHDLALEPRDDLVLAASPIAAGDAALAADAVVHYGAMLRAGQMAGALDAILDMAVRYANERVQFGRPIGTFQIIQQELARLAGLVAAAGTAAEIAFRAASEAPDPALEIAAAAVVVGEAAEHGPRIAHQVHGAIGFTYEHRLHFATRRLWSWRAEFGTPERWAERLGARVLDAGADGLWPLVTSR